MSNLIPDSGMGNVINTFIAKQQKNNNPCTAISGSKKVLKELFIEHQNYKNILKTYDRKSFFIPENEMKQLVEAEMIAEKTRKIIKGLKEMMYFLFNNQKTQKSTDMADTKCPKYFGKDIKFQKRKNK